MTVSLDDQIERLERSRALLRDAMMPPPRRLASDAHGGIGGGWKQRLLDIPSVHIVLDAVRTWWNASPWSTVGALASEASNAAVRPLAREHPVTLVVVGAAVGAVIMRARPWRWLKRQALFAGLLPQIAASLLARTPAPGSATPR